MWFRHVGVRMPAHNIRSVWVTDLLVRETSISTRESYAHAMGHSTKVQAAIYNRASQGQAVSLALTDHTQQVDIRAERRLTLVKGASDSSGPNMASPGAPLAPPLPPATPLPPPAPPLLGPPAVGA